MSVKDEPVEVEVELEATEGAKKAKKAKKTKKARLIDFCHLKSKEKVLSRPPEEILNPVGDIDFHKKLLRELYSEGREQIVVPYTILFETLPHRVVETTKGDYVFYANEKKKEEINTNLRRYVEHKIGPNCAEIAIYLSRHFDKDSIYYVVDGVYVGSRYMLEPWNKPKAFKKRFIGEDPALMLEVSKEYWKNHAFWIGEGGVDINTLNLDTRTTKTPPGW